MGAFVDDTADTRDLSEEKQQHDTETTNIFPHLHTLINAETRRWEAEDAAFAAEAEVSG